MLRIEWANRGLDPIAVIALEPADKDDPDRMPDPLGQFHLGFRDAEQGEAVSLLRKKIEGILFENMRGCSPRQQTEETEQVLLLYRVQMVEEDSSIELMHIHHAHNMRGTGWS